MRSLKYLFIHCTASRERSVPFFTASKLVAMHTAPPPTGRGWRQVGYSALILDKGRIARFTTDNADGWVDPKEVTNGAGRYNSSSKHICYVGGCDDRGKPKNTLQPAQEASLIREIENVLVEKPDVLILGHNQVSNKACPSFSVIKWLEKHLINGTIAGLTEGNICRDDVFKHAFRLD